MPLVASPPTRRRAGTALAVCLLLTAAGCSSKASISGKVIYKNKPLPGGTISFVPVSGGGTGGSSAINPKDGSYSIDQLPTGEMKIVVQPYRPPRPPVVGPGAARALPHIKGPPASAGLPEGADAKMFDPVQSTREKAQKDKESGAQAVPDFPGKYSDFEQTDLTFTVKGGANSHDVTIP